VLADTQRPKEKTRGVAADPGAQQLIDLHDHGVAHDQISAEFGDEARGEAMRLVAPISGREQRSGVSDDVQRAGIGSRR
jgi:hypothetical protein